MVTKNAQPGPWTQLLEKPIELPWAFQYLRGRDGHATDDNYRYFRSRAEAEKSMRFMDRKGRWHGPIEYRPGRCWHGGYVF
jgi:hypothetical protein